MLQGGVEYRFNRNTFPTVIRFVSGREKFQLIDGNQLATFRRNFSGDGNWMSSAGKVFAEKIELKTLLKYFESFRSLPFSPSFFSPIDFIFLYRLNKHEMILIPFPRNESKGKFYFMTTRGSCREFWGFAYMWVTQTLCWVREGIKGEREWGEGGGDVRGGVGVGSGGVTSQFSNSCEISVQDDF